MQTGTVSDRRKVVKMTGYYTYFAFVAVLLAVLAVKWLPVALTMYYDFSGLWAGM